MRRTIVAFVAGLACCLPTAFSVAQGPSLSADDLPVESLAQRQRVVRRGVPPPTVRRYRSYAIVPGEVTESVTPAPVPADALAPSVAPAAPPRASSPAPRSTRSSKPSYMRADSKARGQFGR